MEPVKLSQLSRTNIRRIIHDDPKPKAEVVAWNLLPTDRIIYAEALTGEMCLYLPDKFDPSNLLSIKRLHTSKFTVYIKPLGDLKIEGEEGTLLDDEDTIMHLRFFDGGWHVF